MRCQLDANKFPKAVCVVQGCLATAIVVVKERQKADKVLQGRQYMHRGSALW